MQTWCLSCTKQTDNIASKEVIITNKVARQYKNELIVWVKKSVSVEEQETKGILSSLEIKTPLRKIALFGDIFF